MDAILSKLRDIFVTLGGRALVILSAIAMMVAFILVLVAMALGASTVFLGGGNGEDDGGNGEKKPEQFYHGSQYGDIQMLQPHASLMLGGKPVVFAIADPVMAALFGGGWNDHAFGLGRAAREDPYKLIERFPGAFAQLNRPVFVYRVGSATFTKDTRTGMVDEYVSEEPVRVTEPTRIENLREHLVDHPEVVTMVTFEEFLERRRTPKIHKLADPHGRVMLRLVTAEMNELYKYVNWPPKKVGGYRKVSGAAENDNTPTIFPGKLGEVPGLILADYESVDMKILEAELAYPIDNDHGPVILVGDDMVFDGGERIFTDCMTYFIASDYKKLLAGKPPGLAAHNYWEFLSHRKELFSSYREVTMDDIVDGRGNIFLQWKLRQAYPAATFIHVTGPSGAGKTTLMKKLMDRGDKGLIILDADTIDDAATLDGSGEDGMFAAFKVAITPANVTRGVVVIGLPIGMTSLCDEHYLLDTDAATTYKRVTRRHMEIICAHSEAIMKELDGCVDMAALTTAFPKLCRKYEIRGPVPPHPDGHERHWNNFHAEHLALGYTLLSSDDALGRIGETKNKQG